MGYAHNDTLVKDVTVTARHEATGKAMDAFAMQGLLGSAWALCQAQMPAPPSLTNHLPRVAVANRPCGRGGGVCAALLHDSRRTRQPRFTQDQRSSGACYGSSPTCGGHL